MADDGLNQIYGIRGLTGVSQGNVFPRTRMKKRQERQKKEFAKEYKEAASESGEEEKKGVDIKV